MWIASKHGFFSIVQTQQDNDQFMVRARAEKDLQNLKVSLSVLKNHEIKVTKQADYHFRIIISKKELKNLMQHFAETIDYTNFKNNIGTISDQRDKLSYYHEIWETMYRYQKYSE